MAIGPPAPTMAVIAIIAHAKAGHTHAHQGVCVAVDMPTSFPTGGQSYTSPAGKVKGHGKAEAATRGGGGRRFFRDRERSGLKRTRTGAKPVRASVPVGRAHDRARLPARGRRLSVMGSRAGRAALRVGAHLPHYGLHYGPCSGLPAAKPR